MHRPLRQAQEASPTSLTGSASRPPSPPRSTAARAASSPSTPRRCPDGRELALGLDPGDGHTLETVLPDIKALTGAGIKRVLADAGYKGHNAPLAHKFHVFTTGQKRGVTETNAPNESRATGIWPNN